jgi:hypothetical protein
MKINGGKRGKINPYTNKVEHRFYRRGNKIDVFSHENGHFVETKVFQYVSKAKEFLNHA